MMETSELPDDPDEREALGFAVALAGMLPAFGPVLAEAEAFWAPDQPRAGMLLGDLGAELARGFTALEPAARTAVLARVEEGAARTPEDDYLSTAVCTGLLESLIHRAETLEIWPNVEAALGPASRAYADAYRSVSFELTEAEQAKLFLAGLDAADDA